MVKCEHCGAEIPIVTAHQVILDYEGRAHQAHMALVQAQIMEDQRAVERQAMMVSIEHDDPGRLRW